MWSRNKAAIQRALIALRLFLFGLIPIGCVAVYIRVSYMYTEDWFAELLAFAIPAALLLNLIVVIVAIPFRGRWANLILPLLALLVAQKPMKETFALNFRHVPQQHDFRVMSYNVASFSPGRMAQRQGDTLTASRVYDWLRNMDSPDVLCIQEFYHSEWDEYDQTLDSMVEAGGYRYYYLNPTYVEEFKGIFGVVTFAKKRPLRSGKIGQGGDPVNKGTYHDFVFNSDTVRIMNLHLTSMSIRWQHHDTLKWWQNLKLNAENIIPRLKDGHLSRREEMDCVLEAVAYSPYPVLVCADLNALPYSETYQSLKRLFTNTFEEIGLGMGITVHRFPFFVRIDNFFYGKRLRPEFFLTHKEFDASDHYPIEAGYSFE